MVQITKELCFDYGHRVPCHKSKCKNLHGHRGVIQVTLEGGVQPIRQQSDDGMVIDFTDVKTIANEHVADFLDHAFIVYNGDTDLVSFLKNIEGHNTVFTNFIPTAENLAQWAYNVLVLAYEAKYGSMLSLKMVRFYETPTSWADATSLQIDSPYLEAWK